MSVVRDQVAIVTGANSGIGAVTALELARAGAHVFLACRSESKAAPVVERIRREVGHEQVEFLSLDLADLQQVRASAACFLDRGLPLGLLINNAGLASTRGTTADGFELAFGVNHLGHFLFTLLLLDALKASASARVVNVSSKAHYRARGVDFEKVRGPTRTFIGMREYSVSKLANVLFSAELGRRLEGTGVTTYSLHPGVVATDVWRRMPWPVDVMYKSFMLSAEEGAATTLHCAMSEEAATETGLYYDQCKVRTPSPAARDAVLAAELWERSVDLAGLSSAL